MKKAGRIGLVFGVFDGLHEGHKHFINEAETQCDELVVAVAPDSVVKALKRKDAKQSLEERIRVLQAWNRALDVRAGDERPGSWGAVRDVRPDIIFLGYDQQALKAELARFGIPIVVLKAYEPEKYKSSFHPQ